MVYDENGKVKKGEEPTISVINGVRRKKNL